MKIFIGADHRGFKLKEKLKGLLAKLGHQVVDLGSYDEESCDYPLISCKVASSVAKTKNSRGILVCMTGIGHSMAANKVPGVLAALCYNKEAAELSRQHNNANVLILGAKFVTPKQLRDIVVTWLKAEFEGGRHLRRVNQIKQIEKHQGKCIWD
jgi:ribose 5-phosphate isomerase B